MEYPSKYSFPPKIARDCSTVPKCTGFCPLYILSKLCSMASQPGAQSSFSSNFSLNSSNVISNPLIFSFYCIILLKGLLPKKDLHKVFTSGGQIFYLIL